MILKWQKHQNVMILKRQKHQNVINWGSQETPSSPKKDHFFYQPRVSGIEISPVNPPSISFIPAKGPSFY